MVGTYVTIVQQSVVDLKRTGTVALTGGKNPPAYELLLWNL
jgi:hypothetical protein